MQLALSTTIAPPPVPVWGELSENLRLGFTSHNPALYLGHSVSNSTTALGFESSLLLNRVRLRCSGEQFDSDLGLYYLRARYYNPITGRFMSRDPEDHSPMNPNSLHKYLYANGDPVNRVDPNGKAGLVEFGEEEEGTPIKAGTLLRYSRQLKYLECVDKWGTFLAQLQLSGYFKGVGSAAELNGIVDGLERAFDARCAELLLGWPAP